MLASAKKVSYHGYQPTEAKYVSSQKCSLVQSEERDYTDLQIDTQRNTRTNLKLQL